MEARLGRSARAKVVPWTDEAAAQVLVVVDLPVEDDDLGAVFVEDRLPAAAQIDDAEPAHAEPDPVADVDPLVIRAAMLHRGAHAAYQCLRHRPLPLPVHDSCDAAHVA